MKMRLTTVLDVEVDRYNDLRVTAPEYIDLYSLGFIQCGKPEKEGHKRWCFRGER